MREIRKEERVYEGERKEEYIRDDRRKERNVD